jgi:sugar-specific transcriptional regulator TrmB
MKNDPVSMRQALKELGLSTYEANCYVVLLTSLSPTATEISRLSGVPRQKIYEAMEKLHLLGLCSVKAGLIRRFEATPPAEAFAQLSEKLKKEATERIGKAQRMSEMATMLYESAKGGGDLMTQVEICKNRAQVRRTYYRLLDSARSEIVAFHKPPYVVHPHDLKQKKEALERGVDMRVIYETLPDSGKQRALEKEIKARSRVGEKSRLSGLLPMKLLVVDGACVLLALEHGTTGAPSFTSLAIRHQGLAKALSRSFEVYWSECGGKQRK